MKISFGSGHDHASLVSSPTLNATGDAPCPSFRTGEEDSMLTNSLSTARSVWMSAGYRQKSYCASSFMYRCVDGCISSVSREASSCSSSFMYGCVDGCKSPRYLVIISRFVKERSCRRNARLSRDTAEIHPHRSFTWSFTWSRDHPEPKQRERR